MYWRGTSSCRVLTILNTLDRDDQMAAKIKTQKIPRVSNKTPKTPMPNFQAIKIFRGTTQRGFAETITNLQIVLNTPKSLLKSSYLKNTCQNFLTPWAPVYIVYPQTLEEPVCIMCIFKFDCNTSRM